MKACKATQLTLPRYSATPTVFSLPRQSIGGLPDTGATAKQRGKSVKRRGSLAPLKPGWPISRSSLPPPRVCGQRKGARKGDLAGQVSLLERAGWRRGRHRETTPAMSPQTLCEFVTEASRVLAVMSSPTNGHTPSARACQRPMKLHLSASAH